MADFEENSSVRVAVRIRPQLSREKIDNCRICTSVTPGEPQVVLGNDKAFTFDKVFGIDTVQDLIFREYAQPLIDGCLEGYNATILAYGQTGSGKTYSMGTGFDVNSTEDEMGIIPRAVRHLFNGVQKRKQHSIDNSLPEPTFQVLAQFMELYNEDIYDLFDAASLNSDGKKSKSHIKIHESANGSIYTQGIVSKPVNSYNETMECLRTGALSRTTASTNMNSQSSRSHAIFTLLIKQTRSTLQPSGDESKDVDTAVEDFETLTAKFNFVDLAGSERLKRTGATGDRAKEGISINCGLLALGNVISALGDALKKGSHVPYRDSKLTRLLQDSLGGNSRTVMIACISPSDQDFMETLNTLKYANRARNIKNRVVVNQDKSSLQLTELRAQIQALQVELVEYKQGKRMVGPDGVESINDMFHENSLLQVENDKMRHRVKSLQETVDSLTSRNASLANDRAAVILSGLTGDNMNAEVQKLIAGYNSEIESLRTKLLEAEAINITSSKAMSRTPTRMAGNSHSGMLNSSIGGTTSISSSVDGAMSIIELAKQDVEKRRRVLLSRQSSRAELEEVELEEKGDSGGGSGGDGEDSGEPDGEGEESEDDEEEEEGADDELLHDLSSESDDDVEQAPLSPLSPSGPPPIIEDDRLQEDLAELSGEISLKQRMIDELEKSQKQLQNIRQSYEDKLRNLQDKIRAIERERDQVLDSLGSKSQQSDEQVKKVKSEYEKKLSGMQAELSKVNSAKKEHAKMMKNQAVYDKRIKELSSDLNDMKKNKVRLMAQMKTESEKNKLSDQKKSKELIQLKKEKRLRDNQVRMLELQNRQKDVILKRKHEEVSQLRKKQREASASSRVLAKNKVNLTQHSKAPTSAKVVKPVGSGAKASSSTYSVRAKSSKSATAIVFSPKVAKSKWDKLEHYISSVVLRKQTISSMEAEMDLHINKREELSKKIELYSRRLDEAINRDDTELAMDIEDQLETMTTNMNYIQSNVSECQTCIMQMEEEARDETELGTLMNVTSLDESKYLMNHFLSLALSRGFACTQKEAQYKELNARYEKMQLDSRLRDQLLEQVLQESGISLQTQHDFDHNEEGVSGDNSSSCRSSPLSGDLMSTSEEHYGMDGSRQSSKNRKARRRTATPAELLMGMCEPDLITPTSSNAASPTTTSSGKPSINIADIIPPAPRGPPPGRGPPPPAIDTIIEEEESEARPHTEDGSNRIIRTGSYTVLNSVVVDKPQIYNPLNPLLHPDGNHQNGYGSSSGASSPENDLEKDRLLGGSYTILNGEITLDASSPGDQGDIAEPQLDADGKRIPPPVPPKPTKPASFLTGPIAGSQGMNKWKNIVSSHLDDVIAGNAGVDRNITKPPFANASGDQKFEQLPAKDAAGRIVGRRKLAPGTSPSLRRKTFQPSLQLNRDKSTPLSPEVREVRLTPPSSPSLGRRRTGPQDIDSSNVFMRLTNHSATSTSTKRSSKSGSIISSDRGSSTNQSMVCMKQAKGHSKAVLSICATETLLISGSKDLTCKVWDLDIGSELMSLEGHPNYVTNVRYCEVNKLVYSVSNSFVKIWDIRSGAKCIKVLSSSGLVHDSVPVEPASSSQAILQQGEQQIFDIQLAADGQTLYTTTGTTVRIWDLRTYCAMGKIVSGHQAPIICLKLHSGVKGNENLITGSKDHLIKLFDLSNYQSSNCLVQPKFTLEPPHYDGVQCFAHRGSTLFSGSRDMHIKKWDIGEDPVQRQSVNGAHGNWILDMCMLPDNDVLLSCCRSGYVKLWSSDTCNQLDIVRAHSSSVNCLATNSSKVFTASSDCSVKIWSVDSQKLAWT